MIGGWRGNDCIFCCIVRQVDGEDNVAIDDGNRVNMKSGEGEICV